MDARSPIYLDHHATTPVDPRVLDAMLPYFREDFGNAASGSHVFGWRAAGAVDDARERIADLLGTEPREIFFTGGATESNNLAILGTARARRTQGRHVLTIATEHPSVLDPMRALEREGFESQILPVDSNGLLDPNVLCEAIRDETTIVSIAAANGEIGVIQPLDELADICCDRGVKLHSDAAQAAGKIRSRVDECRVDLLSVSGHKIYGPKGVGVLYVRNPKPANRPEPLVYGGGQEGGLRSGTLAVPQIVGLAKALELCVEELDAEAKRLLELRNRLLNRLSAGSKEIAINGDLDRRLPGNLNLSFPGVDSERLLLALPDIAVSTGSACSSASPEPSHVLLAIGLSEGLARASIRFGLGRATTQEQIDRVSDRILEEIAAQTSPGAAC